MKTVEVDAAVRYNIVIDKGILPKSGDMIKEVTSAERVAVITDDTVDKLYSAVVMKSLSDAGFETFKFVFPHGEKSKNISTFSSILEFLADSGLTRTDALVALGGGVVGDVAGFAAASYLRGIDFIQIPTTLLACVDSSVGGKTAIDLKAGKNLAGAFYQPKLVIADFETLSTLTDGIFADGMAEVIKYGVIFDKAFFEFLRDNEAKDNLEYVITRCVELKRDIVNADEKEKGVRALLNFGHTVGHAIEKCSGYKIPHGSAVAVGMVIISRAAYKCSFCDENCTDIIASLNKKYSLPVSTDFSASELSSAAMADKKRAGDKIKLIIPEALGNCVIKSVPTSELEKIIGEGLC
jgi:3-dehydroquinate synthase